MEYEDYDHVRSQTLGRGVVIAIDGPSGSGKSSVAKQVAAALSMGYLDTGAMYRAAAWWCEYQKVDFSDPAVITETVEKMELEINAMPHAPRILVGGMDVTKVIREPHVSEIVSTVSTILPVRQILISRQQKIIDEARAAGRGIVAEGRDITTVVAPDAEVRILLTAAPEVRLARRSHDDLGSIESEALEQERDVVLGRDAKDATVAQFEEPTEGVHKVDSSDLSLHETVDAVMYLIGQELA